MDDNKPRAVAIDLGSQRVGVAISDELGTLAHPRPYLDGRDRAKLIAALKELGRAENVQTFLVGLPRALNGQEGIGARRARQFARELELATGNDVELLDERLSTVQASARLRDQGLNARQQRERIDSAAAAILLQCWLDARARVSD
jgi:putative Holliday junction resolvase